MIDKFIQGLVDKFISNNLIGEDQREEYIYSMLCFCESFITIGSILLIGMIMKCFVPTLCFCFFFFLLRKRTGGFHLPTFCQCYIGSLVIFSSVVWGAGMIQGHENIIIIVTLLSFICIMSIGTINHPNMMLSDDELKALKMSSRLVLCMEISLILFMIWMNVDYILIWYSCSGIILCALRLIIAKFIKQEVKRDG